MSDTVAIPLHLQDKFSRGLINLIRGFDQARAAQSRFHQSGIAGAKRWALAQNTAAAALRGTTAAAAVGVRSLTNSMQGLVNSTMRWGKVAAAAGAGGLALMLRQGVKLNSEMEKYQITLTSLLKSQARANSLIQHMTRLAERTPFRLEGIIEATSRLEAFGLSSKRWIPVLGDISAAFGGTAEQIEQLVRAMGMLRSGRTGEAFESLSRFGISRQEFRDRGIKFDRGGALIGDTRDALDALEGIARSRFGGMMQAQSRTLAGITSNLQDMAANILRDSTRGLFERLRSGLGGALGGLDRMRDSGALRLLTSRASSALGSGADALGRFVSGDLLGAFTGGGIGGVIAKLAETAKGPATRFIEWFARTFVDALIGAIRLAFSSWDTAKALGLYFGATRGIGLAGSLAAGAIGSAGTRAAGWIGGRAAGGAAGSMAARTAAGGLSAWGALEAGAMGTGATALAAAQGAKGAARAGLLARLMPTLGWGMAPWVAGAGIGAGITGIAEIATMKPTEVGPWHYQGWLGRQITAALSPNLSEEGAALPVSQSIHQKLANKFARERYGQLGSDVHAIELASTGRNLGIDELLPFVSHAAGLKLTDTVQALGDKFKGLQDGLRGFKVSALDAMNAVSLSVAGDSGGLVANFESLEEQIARLKNRVLPGLQGKVSMAFHRARGTRFDPSNPEGFFESLSAGSEGLLRSRQSMLQAQIGLAGLTHQQNVERAQRARGVLGLFGEAQEAGNTGAFLEQIRRAVGLTSAFERGGLGAIGNVRGAELMRLQSATGGILPQKMIEQMLDREFVAAINQKFGRGTKTANDIISAIDPTAGSAAALETAIEKLTAAFENASQQDAVMLDELAQRADKMLSDAFLSAARDASKLIADQTGLSLAQVFSRELENMLARLEARLRGNRRTVDSVQQ